MSSLYEKIDAELICTKIKVAEAVKYSCNAFHAMKVAFANEIGNLCKVLGIDSHEVMDIFCKDDKLNLSKYYLQPGFAFGGSCLPKDLRALLYKAKAADLETPLLNSVLPSNALQIQHAFNMIRKINKKKVGLLGLSFKAGTDDLRESPVVELIEKLIGKGYDISIYDKEVSMAKIFGANKRYIESVIPHISSLMKETATEVIDNAEVLVFSNRTNENKAYLAQVHPHQHVVDLVKLQAETTPLNSRYEGICW